MRIAAIGYYGFGNAGDERILQCLRQFFHPHDVISIPGYYGLAERFEEVNSCDLVIFGGGGLVYRGSGCFAHLFSRLSAPLVCLGISVEAVHPDNEALIAALLEKSRFIQVRDVASKRAFGSASHVEAGPDLTFLFPFEPIEEAKSDSVGLNLRPWPFWNAEFGSRLDVWMKQKSRRYPIIKAIYPFRKWKPRIVADRLAKTRKSIVPIPLQVSGDDQCDRALLKQFFREVPDSFSVRDFEGLRALVSMRLHGLIFASQCGLPFLSLSYQPKNKAFCDAVNLPELSIDIFSELNALENKLEMLLDNRAGIRERLLEYREAAHHHVWEQCKSLR